jgi:hypothetical protein
MLVSAAFLFLSRPEYPLCVAKFFMVAPNSWVWFSFTVYIYVKYTSDLSSVSRRILLEGPTGTDLYQETLVKALAKQFNAQLLMLDQSYLYLIILGLFTFFPFRFRYVFVLMTKLIQTDILKLKKKEPHLLGPLDCPLPLPSSKLLLPHSPPACLLSRLPATSQNYPRKMRIVIYLPRNTVEGK